MFDEMWTHHLVKPRNMRLPKRPQADCAILWSSDSPARYVGRLGGQSGTWGCLRMAKVLMAKRQRAIPATHSGGNMGTQSEVGAIATFALLRFRAPPPGWHAAEQRALMDIE